MTVISSLWTYPVKSCQGLELTSARVEQQGIQWDRNWMVVTSRGAFVSQRTHPQLTRVSIALDEAALTMSAAGMPDLEVVLGKLPSERIRVDIWDHGCLALDEGEHAASWVSELLDDDYRLVRFDPAHRRESSREWTGQDTGLNRFSDGFPILLVGEKSLTDLNERLPNPVPMNRFRPNIVIEGLEPYDEDHLETLSVGAVTFRVVKPCTRCEITTTDQRTGARAAEPLQTLATYRANARLQGGITFGQNAIVTRGFGETLSVGMTLEDVWTF
jgi:uncharacterized protein